MQPGGVSANDTSSVSLIRQRQQDLAGADDLLVQEMPRIVDERHQRAPVSRDLMDLGERSPRAIASRTAS